MKPQEIIELEKELGIEFDKKDSYEHFIESTLDRYVLTGYIANYVSRQKKLLALNMTGISLTDISILIHCIDLEYLMLSENKILDISILSNLTKLEHLSLDYNKISDITPLLNLKHLETLSLSDNNIRTFPLNFIQHLPKLHYLSLHGNPIQNIPKEIIEQENCLPALRDYLKSIENPEDRRELNEAKLIFVGRGMVGKTELADALSEENYAFNPKRPMTEGIRIKKWKMPKVEKNGKNIDFSVNIWDFAGQEINYGTHQFFLTKSAVYVLVWRWRVDDPANRFSLEYWTNIIQLLAGDSPVILVQNWIDEDGIKPIPQDQWKRAFPNIVGFYQTSCKNKAGIEALSQKIREELLKLPHTSEVWNKDRLAFRQEIEASQENDISHLDYLRRAEKYGIDRKSAIFLAEQLHKIGVILHYEDDFDLKERVVLKPEWTTQAAYKLIDEKLNPNGGYFTNQDLERIWADEIFEGKRTFLLNLMLRFHLVMNVLGTKTYIVPELLPIETPENLPSIPAENRLYFEYHYSFMPKGILSRFICLSAKYLKEESRIWYYGVFLTKNGAKAKVDYDELSHYIRMEVGGQHSEDLLKDLRSRIQEVHEKLEEPPLREVIPCFCEVCQNTAKYLDRHFFDYDSLMALKKEGETHIRCAKNVKAKFSIDKLLTGIEPLKSKEDLILEKLERIESNTEQILQIFSQEFSQLKQNLSLQEEERFRLLGELIDKQKPQNLNNYEQKAQIEFPKFNSLQAESKIFLAMAFYFLEILPDSGDFSPAVLQFCRALELEMKAVLLEFKNLNLPILLNDNGLGQNQQAYNWFKSFMNGEEITLPQMKAIFEKMSNLQGTQVFLAFNNFLVSKPLYANLNNFVILQNEIKNKDYRNKSAHTHPLSKLEAQDCKGLVFKSLELWF